MHQRYAKLTEEELRLHVLKSELYGPVNLVRWGPVYNIMRFINKAALIERRMKRGDQLNEIELKALREDLLDIAIHAKIAICLIDDGFDVVPLKVKR